MSALTDTCRDPTQSHGWRVEPQIDNFDAIACRLQELQEREIGAATHGSFKGEADTRLRQFLKFRQNQPTGGQSRESGIKRRETGGNKVGIDEMHDARLLGEELARKGGLSRPVWTGNDDTARLWVQMDGVFHQ